MILQSHSDRCTTELQPRSNWSAVYPCRRSSPIASSLDNMQPGYDSYSSCQGSWSQPPEQQYTGPAHASQRTQQHMHSTSFQSTQTNMPRQRAGPCAQNAPSQQWSMPAAAPERSTFNYGFGQMPSAPQPLIMPSSSHQSSTPYMGHPESSTYQQHHQAQHSSYQQAQEQLQTQQPGMMMDAFPGAELDNLKSVKDLPTAFQPIFKYRYFNPVQSECFDVACSSDTNMVVSAPTGAGKTGVMELAMLRLLSKHLNPTAPAAPPMGAPRPQQHFQSPNGSHKTIYLGPIKALVQERQMDWQARFGQVLGLKVVQLTGDDDSEGLDDLEAADVICSTPEKFDQVTRKVAEKGSMGFFGEIGLVLLDEVHLLNESGRGSSLEAGCVCRIKAMAAFPELSNSHIASVRFVAVSATIPNFGDIASWLSVPPTGLRQYGDELRPCKLTTHVKGYNPSKNDFLFERRLNDHVYTIVKEYSKGRPALVFCSSRKGTVEAASAIVKEAEAHAQVASYSAPGTTSTGSTFVRDMQQLQRLRAAAADTQAKALASLLVAGVGFHNAAMEPADRAIVEDLFKANDLAVLCTTSTLAMGVNLPAHLVVLKGTVRWVGDTEVLPGEQPGYKEYSQTEVLQMVGRAGRPQFDTHGIAVIMTSRDSTHRYQRLLAGQVVESCLLSTLPEHLNAEIVLGTVKDLSQAIAWIRSTFLFTRVRANPAHYGVKLKPGLTEAELDVLLRDQIVLQPVQELMKYQLIETDEDNYSLAAAPAGKLMAAHFLKLKTMAAIVQLGERPNVPSLLRVICAAEEFKNTGLRRSEKKALNEINHSKDPEQVRYHVMASKEGNKIKERISLPAEKLFILLNDALADKPSELLDYSLKQEQTRLMVVGQRIAKCMAKYYALRGSFSSAGRSLLLTRSLKTRLWEDSKCSVRQLPSVGRQLGARLAAAGLGSLQAVAACGDAHRLEVAAQKPYPWGSELLAALKAASPPAIDINLQLLGPLPGNRGYNCQVTLSKVTAAVAGTAGSNAAAMQAGGLGPGIAWAGTAQQSVAADSSSNGSSSFSPCKLLVGCSSTDDLLLLRGMVLERLNEAMQVQFKVLVPAGVNQPLNVTAMLLHERYVGFDQKASMALPALGQQYRQQQGGNSNTTSQLAGRSTAPVEQYTCADAIAEEDEAMEQADNDSEQASLGAAAEAYAAVQRKQQMRNKRAREQVAVTAAAASAEYDTNAGQGMLGQQHKAHVSAAAAGGSVGGMPAPAKRSRGDRLISVPGLLQISDGAPPQQQQQQPWSLQGNPGKLQGDMPQHVTQALEEPAQSSMQFGSNSAAGSAFSQHAAAPPQQQQSSIAARYKSKFSMGAAGLISSQERSADQPSRSVPGLDAADCSTAPAAGGGGAAAGAAAAHAAAAMDAGELQVTPALPDKTPKSAAHASAHGAARVQHGDESNQAAGAVHQQQHVNCARAQHLLAADAGHGNLGRMSPVRDVGQAMSSLFDMLADDEDAVELEPQQQQQPHPFSLPTSRQPFKPGGFSGAAAAADVAPDGASTQLGVLGTAAQEQLQPPPQQQLAQQKRPVRKPLGEIQGDTQQPADASPSQPMSQLLPPDRAAASAAFGAAVQRSLQSTSSLLTSLPRRSSLPSGLPPVVSSDAVNLAGVAARRSMFDRQPRRQQQQQQQQQQDFAEAAATVGGPGQKHGQQLMTPPHQIRPVFTGVSASAAAGGSHKSSSSVAGDFAAALQTDRQLAPQGTRELPDFRKFAFNAGPNAPPGTQSAAFKPSANSMLFGHLPAAQPRSAAQGKLLTRPSPASNASTRGAQYSQQQLQQAGRATHHARSMQGQAAGDMWGQLGSNSSGAPATAGLPGSVAWGQFVSGRQAAAVAVPPGGVLDEPADDGSQRLEEQDSQQQQQTAKQARAGWQRPAGASRVKRSSTAAAFAASSFGSSSSMFRLQGAAATWGSPWQDPFEEQSPSHEASVSVAAAPPPPPPASMPAAPPAAAAVPPLPRAPAVPADQPPNASPAREPIGIADALDIGDIFAFMR